MKPIYHLKSFHNLFYVVLLLATNILSSCDNTERSPPLLGSKSERVPDTDPGLPNAPQDEANLLHMLNLLHQDRMQHRSATVVHDAANNLLVFRQRFAAYTVNATEVFHARWAETLITLGGTYVAEASGGMHSFANDPHNYHHWSEYNYAHAVVLDGKPFKNANFNAPKRIDSVVFIDNRGFSSITEVVNAFLTRLFTDVMMSGQNEDYYQEKVKGEPQIGNLSWNAISFMVNEPANSAVRFHPITGDGPNRFRAYAQERPLGVLDKKQSLTQGYHLEVDGSTASSLTINVQNHGARDFTNDVVTYLKRFFAHLAPHLKVEQHRIIISVAPIKVITDIVRDSIYFAGAVVTNQQGQIQVGYRYGKGYATGGGFSSDKYSKLMVIERDSIDEFSVIGARPGKFFEVSNYNHTFVAALDLENCSATKIAPATDEFDAKTIGFNDITALRALSLRKIPTFNDYLKKYEQAVITDQLKRVTNAADIEVSFDTRFTTVGGQIKLGKEWGTMAVKSEGKSYSIKNKNPGLIRRHLRSLPPKSTDVNSLIATLTVL